MPEDTLQERMRIMEQVDRLHRAERILYIVFLGAFGLLFFAVALKSFLDGELGLVQISGMFGSGGGVTLFSSRLLALRARTINIVFDIQQGALDNG